MAMKDISDKQVCQAIEDDRAGNFEYYAYDLLMQRTGQPFKVCYRAMERACDRNFIEYGVSLRTGWVTDGGKNLIAN